MNRQKSTFACPDNIARFLRVRMGLTQKQVAEACGLKKFSVSNFERGKTNFTVGNSLRLSAFFHISVNELIYNDYAAVLPRLSTMPQRNISAAQRLDDYKRHADRTGRAGERLVAQLQRKLLRGTPYENGVNEGFADDLSAGYDIMSFRRDGTPLFIEVKATTEGVDEPFYMTTNEVEFMEFCADRRFQYELHRVYNLDKNGNGNVKVYVPQDLKDFHFTVSEYIVERRAA